MDPLSLGLGLGAVGGITNLMGANRQRQLDAATAQYSPWTGMKPKMDTKDPNIIGSIAGGGLSGYQLGQNIELNDALKKNLQGGASPWSGLVVPRALTVPQSAPVGFQGNYSGLQLDPGLQALNTSFGAGIY